LPSGYPRNPEHDEPVDAVSIAQRIVGRYGRNLCTCWCVYRTRIAGKASSTTFRSICHPGKRYIFKNGIGGTFGFGTIRLDGICPHLLQSIETKRENLEQQFPPTCR